MEAASPPTAARESARPATGPDGFDATYDIVVVGGGGAGLPTALFTRWLGNRVLVLEKAPELGGTARKAAFWYWVPNNQPMRELGLEDVTGGTLDTKGGPKATPDGQVLDDQDRPIPGLYGVGNCVASASAQAYWAGGATLGPILALAHRAARAAHAEQVAEPQPVS
jgi:predicted oxidoreductase